MFSVLTRTVKLVLALAIAALLIVFCITNRNAVTIDLFPFPYSADMPEFLLALLCFTAGVIVTGLLGGMSSISGSFKLRSERKRVAALENELLGAQSKQQSSLPAN